MIIEVLRYQTASGDIPISKWLAQLRDPRAKAKIGIRLRRISAGVFGDTKSVGEGVMELRETIGPGYRIYYGRHGTAVVVLLCGGDKSSQSSDIEKAKIFWKDWKQRQP